MCKRFQDRGFVGNKTVSNYITYNPYDSEISVLLVKVTVMEIGVINVTLLLPPTIMLHVCVWFSLRVCQKTIQIRKWVIKKLYCCLLNQSPLSKLRSVFFSIIFTNQS